MPYPTWVCSVDSLGCLPIRVVFFRFHVTNISEEYCVIYLVMKLKGANYPMIWLGLGKSSRIFVTIMPAGILIGQKKPKKFKPIVWVKFCALANCYCVFHLN